MLQALPRNAAEQQQLVAALAQYLRAATSDATLELLPSGLPWSPYCLSLLLKSSKVRCACVGLRHSSSCQAPAS